MTIANINSLPDIGLRFTGRPLSVAKVILVNKESNQEIISTDDADWTISNDVIKFNLLNHEEFRDNITESTSISFAMYDKYDTPIYKDLIRFYNAMNTDSNYTQIKGGTEYIFLDDE